jgi:hypothetical protein
MRDMTLSTATVRSGMNRLSPNHLWGLAARVFTFRADRWRRRATFYERYRDYFPRLSSGRFIDRCRELETIYRRMGERMFAMPVQGQWVPVRSIAVKKKQGRRIALPKPVESSLTR